MIKEISFKNYKAFDCGTIEIMPITLLLGPNSVGKSSILQLLLLLQQTAETHNYKSALKLHGEFASLGEPLNLIKDHDINKVLSFSFKFQNRDFFDYLKSECLEKLSALLIESISIIQQIYKKENNSDKVDELIKEIELYNSKSKTAFSKYKIQSKEHLKKIIAILNTAKSETFIKKIIKETLYFSNSNEYWIYGDRIYNILDSIDEIERIYDFMSQFERLKTNLFTLNFDLKCYESKKDTYFKVCGVSIYNEDKLILKLEMSPNLKSEKYTNIKLSSDYYDKELINDKIKTELESNLKYNSTIFSLFGDYESRFIYSKNKKISVLSNALITLISKACLGVKNSFQGNNINYVSPLRAHPKRYYFLDKANISTHLDTLDGDSLTEILKENNDLRGSVNKWLSTFDLELNVDTLRDIIHTIKIKQNNLSLDITDVGFGISQVLPVIVQGFLSSKNSLTIIEQPEIHLHPKMQADLADLFIDICLKKQNKKFLPYKYLLIETHSEYLLKRLRRRMAEKKSINPENVAIYYFHPRNNQETGIIEKKEINDTGFFQYPKDYYSGELLRDNTEFIKRQIKKRI